MIYRVSLKGIAFEFSKNTGRARVEADDPQEALSLVRHAFEPIREWQVEPADDGSHIVQFKVNADFRLSQLRRVVRAVRQVTSLDAYRQALYLDRYILATIRLETRRPKWLKLPSAKEEVRAMRKAAVVAREINNTSRFLDWDICIYNYIELNFKEGHQSRVVRTPSA
jgi:hypothetical protein